MSQNRHSYIAFYPSDWLGGTARMTRLQRSVYFDVCCYNWDTAKECPASELALMLGDLDGWREIIGLLVESGKLYRTPDGSVGNSKAILEAQKAYELWAKKSKGGKNGAAKTNAVESPAKTAVVSADKSVDESYPGVPTQNQNQNQNQNKESVEDKSSTGANAPVNLYPAWWPKRDRYKRVIGPVDDKLAYQIGRVLFGGGGFVTDLKKNLPNWIAVVELMLEASDQGEPRSWMAKKIKKLNDGEAVLWPSDIYPRSHSEYAA